MNRKVFVASWRDYEDYRPVMMYGPDGMDDSDFRALCERLLPQAASNAVAAEKERHSWVGNDGIHAALIELLIKNGMKEVERCEFGISGGGIIYSKDGCGAEVGDDAIREITEHNLAVHLDMSLRLRDTASSMRDIDIMTLWHGDRPPKKVLDKMIEEAKQRIKSSSENR